MYEFAFFSLLSWTHLLVFNTSARNPVRRSRRKHAVVEESRCLSSQYEPVRHREAFLRSSSSLSLSLLDRSFEDDDSVDGNRSSSAQAAFKVPKVPKKPAETSAARRPSATAGKLGETVYQPWQQLKSDFTCKFWVTTKTNKPKAKSVGIKWWEKKWIQKESRRSQEDMTLRCTRRRWLS